MAPAVSTTTQATATATTKSLSAFAITTTYTTPTQCAQSVGGLTMLQNDEYRIWLNAILPVPNTTITSCYPSQFMSSFLLQTGGVTQAPFSPLVCPAGYTTQGPFTSNYIACCPSGWDGFAPSAGAPSDRPAFGGTCYTNIYNVPIQITSYDDSAIKASSLFTATESLAQAFAYPYEGFALGVVVVASTTGSAAPTATAAASTPSSSSATATAVASSSGSNHLSGGAIAGVIIGSLVGVALLATVAFLLLAYRRRRGGQDSEKDVQYGGSYSDAPFDNIPHPEQGVYRGDHKPAMNIDPELLQQQHQQYIQELDIKKNDPNPEPQELETSRKSAVWEMDGQGTGYVVTEVSTPTSEKKLPDVPSTPMSPVSTRSAR